MIFGNFHQIPNYLVQIWTAKPHSLNNSILLSDWLVTIGTSPLLPDKLFVGANGFAVCLEAATGNTLWEANLKGSFYSNVALLIFNEDLIIVGSFGMIMGLSPRTGEVLWHNKLQSRGSGDVTLAKYEKTVIAGHFGYIIFLNSEVKRSVTVTSSRMGKS